MAFEQPHQESQPLPHYMPQLDALRGLAVLSVLVFHFLPQYFNDSLLGWIGVRLFFVLSGFLITGILFRGHDIVRSGQGSDY